MNQTIYKSLSENTFKPKAIHFGIDYVRLAYPHGFAEVIFAPFFEGLSANSNYREKTWYDTHFTIDYIWAGLQQRLIFRYDNIPVFYLVDYGDRKGHNVTKVRYLLDIYSSAFYVPDLQRFFSKFWRHVGFKGRVTRLDLALDLLCRPEEVTNAGYVTQFPRGAKFGFDERTGECETRYFGDKASKNKRHLIRIYDKLKDSQAKEKLKLFGHYFQFDNVTRLEVEIRSLTCKELNILATQIGDVDFLESLFRTLVINPNGTHFKALEHLDFSRTQKIKVNRDNVEVQMSRLQSSKRLLGMATNLHTAGAEPINYLIEQFTRAGVYQNPKSLHKLQKAVHNAEVLAENYPGFNTPINR